jgi:hypothetical protein
MLLALFIILFSLFSQDSYSWTAPLVNPSNPSFLTGIITLISTSDPQLTSGTRDYQFPLANALPNNSVKGVAGIVGQEMTLIPPGIDYDIFVISVSNLTMYIRATMISTLNPLKKMKICYMVTSYFLLKIDYKAHTFGMIFYYLSKRSLTRFETTPTLRSSSAPTRSAI